MTDDKTINIYQNAIASPGSTVIGYIEGDVHIHEAATPLDRYAERLRLRVEEQEAFYVPLPTEARIQSKFAAYDAYLPRNIDAPESERFDTIEEALEKYERFILIGDPGSGKTTTLRHVALGLLGAYQSVRREGQFARLPFWIDLGYSDNPPDARQLVEHWWTKRQSIQDGLTPLLDDGHLWLLLDGLNEMPDSLTGPGSIKSRGESLKDFLEGYEGRVIVTCRVADYDQRLDLGLPVVRVLKLQEDVIQAFAHKYLGERADEFRRALEDAAGARALANNPYALTMMLEVFSDPRYELPRSREALFDVYIQKRYDDNQRDVQGPSRVTCDLDTLKAAWGKLAYHMMMDGHGTTVDEEWAIRHAVDFRWRRLSRFGPRNLKAALDLSLITQGDEANIRFYHQSLYEHFALPLIELKSESGRGEQLLARWLSYQEELSTNFFVDRWIVIARTWHDRLGSTRHRMTLLERLGNLEDIALPVLPRITDLYVAQADKDESILVYNVARWALIGICLAGRRLGRVENDVARCFALFLLLETTLRIGGNPRFHDGTLVRDITFVRNIDLARALVRDLTLSRDLVRDLNRASERSRRPNVLFQARDLAHGLERARDFAHAAERTRRRGYTRAFDQLRYPRLFGNDPVRQRALKRARFSQYRDDIYARNNDLYTALRRSLSHAFKLANALSIDLDSEKSARELGLNPYDPDKIQAARRAIHAELRELAEQLSKVDEMR